MDECRWCTSSNQGEMCSWLSWRYQAPQLAVFLQIKADSDNGWRSILRFFIVFRHGALSRHFVQACILIPETCPRPTTMLVNHGIPHHAGEPPSVRHASRCFRLGSTVSQPDLQPILTLLCHLGLGFIDALKNHKFSKPIYKQFIS